MYCNNCGSPLQANQGVCGRCGNAVVGRVVAGRVQQHASLLGALWCAYSVVYILIGIGAVVVSTVIFAPDGPAPDVPGFVPPLVRTGGILFLAKGVADAVAGYGLLQRAGWARPLALVMAFLALINLPFGTALGVYTLWVLLPQDSADEYERLSAVSTS
jgi:hypothetical protein